MNLKKAKILSLMVVAAMSAGCASLNNLEKGGAIGAGAGGVLGGIIGKQSGNTTAGILIGAVIGGAAGGAIGHYMDKQAEELQQDLKNARVERVGEGIKITFNSGILFDTDSSALKPAAKTNIEDLSKTLNKYKDTKIIIQGYTDSTGSADHNLQLSRNRAQSVADYSKAQGVSGGRIDTAGFGEDSPVGDNTTMQGRAENRRVELAIFADEKLKKAAQKGQL